MPRKRPKTAADRPAYRATAPRSVPDAIEPFLAVLELHRLVKKYGAADVQTGLNVIAEHERRMMIERRSSEMLDAWKSKTRPLGLVRIPRAVAGRRWHRRSQTLEQHLDNMIYQQARAQELEDGLAVMLDRLDGGSFTILRKRAQLREIVSRVKDGETAEQIAAALNVSVRTIENRLAELRDAAEEKELAASAS